MANQQNPDQMVEKALSTPQSYEQDGEKVTSRSVSDIISAAKFLARRRMKLKHAFGALGVAKISTPGTDEI